MNKFFIDDSFIAKWHPRYDEIECDEEEYQKIIKQVKVDIADGGTISYETTKRLLKWKKARRATNFILDNFAKFDEVIKKCCKAPEGAKLQILDDLPGIGVPVGSTFLPIRVRSPLLLTNCFGFKLVFLRKSLTKSLIK